MSPGKCKIAAKQGLFHFHGMNERKYVCDLLKKTAQQRQIKPHAREPCGKVGQQRAAKTALGIMPRTA